MDPEDACETCKKSISVAHCKTCKEDYCESCLQCHMNFKATRDHKIRRFAEVTRAQNEERTSQTQESFGSSILEMENDASGETPTDSSYSDISSKVKAMTFDEEEALGSSLLELERNPTPSSEKADDVTVGRIATRDPKTQGFNRQMNKTRSLFSQSEKPPPIAPKPRTMSVRMPSTETEFQWSIKDITFQDKISCYVEGDQKTPKLAGLECLQNGNVVVLDEANKRLKLYDKTFHYISGALVADEAIDMTITSQTSVTVLAGTTLYIYENSPSNTISKMQELHLDPADDAVAVSFANGYYAVLFALPSRVDILDSKGSTLRSIPLEELERGLTLQNSITISSSGDSFYISDMSKGRIVCFSTLSTKLWEYPCRGVVCRTPTSVFLVCDTLKEFRDLSKEGEMLTRFTSWNNEISSTECARFHLQAKHLLLVGTLGHEIFRFKIDF